MRRTSLFYYAMAWAAFFAHLVVQTRHGLHGQAQSANDADLMALGCFFLLNALWFQRRDS